MLAIFHVQLKSKMEDFLTNNKGLDYDISGINIYVIWSTLKLAGSWQKHLVVVFFFPYINSSNLVVSPFLLISSMLNKAKGFKSIWNIHTVGVCYTKPGWVEWGIAF